MKNKWIMYGAAAVLLTGCGRQTDMSPLMGLEWFSAYDDVRSALSGMTVTAERESGEAADKQYFIDCTGAELFSVNCDLTVCCTADGLVGLNYHDTARTQGYREWFSALEQRYGYPTEQGSGIASWYAEPLGRNTAVYLFNLSEGVQISVYATDVTPDQEYGAAERARKAAVSPELRSAVIPVENSAEQTQTETTAASTAETTQTIPEEPVRHTGIFREPEPDAPAQTSAEAETTDTETTVSGTAAAETTVSASTEKKTADSPPRDPKSAYQPDGIAFYCDIETARKAMRKYSLLYDYRIEETGQPWEQILEYSGVSYLDERCDAALCFTSLGLVGINYFDAKPERFAFWRSALTDIYGEPDTSEPDYVRWNRDPNGKNTAVYVFALEDGVQISFYSDDTGSELAGT